MSSSSTRSGRIRLPSSSSSSYSSTSILEPWRRSLTSLTQIRSASDLSRLLLKSYPLHPDLPVRVRPLMAFLTALSLLVLAALGFHPTLAEKFSPPVPWSDKLLHFVCFTFASAQFYAIWNVDPGVRRVWYWKWFNEIISGVVCGLWGAIGSEFIQGMLPYKTFQWGDIIANILGVTLGTFIARRWTIARQRAQEIRRLYQPLQLGTDPASDDEEDDEMERGELLTEGMGVGRGRSESNPWDDAEDTGSIFGVGADEEDEMEDRQETGGQIGAK